MVGEPAVVSAPVGVSLWFGGLSPGVLCLCAQSPARTHGDVQVFVVFGLPWFETPCVPGLRSGLCIVSFFSHELTFPPPS